MEKKEFYEVVKKGLLDGGFEKIKNKFYRRSEDFLCEVNIQKSNYGEFCYINLYFYIGKFEKPYTISKDIWEIQSPFLYSRFRFDEIDREIFDYTKYDQKQVTTAVLNNLNDLVYPPFDIGKKYLLNNFQIKYRSTFDAEEAKKSLE